MSRLPGGRGPRTAVLLVWFALIAALLAWLLGMPGRGSWFTAILTTVPLLLPLPGLWQGRRYTHRWAAITLVPAMAWSLTELVANPAARVPAGMTALLGFLALAALVAVLRAPSVTAD